MRRDRTRSTQERAGFGYIYTKETAPDGGNERNEEGGEMMKRAKRGFFFRFYVRSGSTSKKKNDCLFFGIVARGASRVSIGGFCLCSSGLCFFRSVSVALWAKRDVRSWV